MKSIGSLIVGAMMLAAYIVLTLFFVGLFGRTLAWLTMPRTKA